jgi:uncharacterized protein (UPF0332 family)
MDSKDKLYIERAENEVILARAIFSLSEGIAKKELFVPEDITFYSAVISHAYYCIFYSAKALLYIKGISTEAPEEHKKTLEEFEKLTLSGEIDTELLLIYKSIVIKADELLGIFRKEKSKKGKFTYQKLPQANLIPAEESLNNAKKFFKNVNLMIDKDDQ